MKKGKSWVLFWGGMALLLIDLLTYYNSIRVYFTTFGISLLIASIALLIISQFTK